MDFTGSFNFENTVIQIGQLVLVQIEHNFEFPVLHRIAFRSRINESKLWNYLTSITIIYVCTG